MVRLGWVFRGGMGSEGGQSFFPLAETQGCRESNFMLYYIKFIKISFF